MAVANLIFEKKENGKFVANITKTGYHTVVQLLRGGQER